MKKYRYNGKLPVHLAMIGDVAPGKTIEVENINHPDFEEVKEQAEVAKQPVIVNK